MSIFKADKSNASNHFSELIGDVSSNKSEKTNSRLESILNEVSDDSSVAVRRTESTGGGNHRRSMSTYNNVQSSVKTDMYRLERQHRTILPDVLATESIENMLGRIENSLALLDSKLQRGVVSNSLSIQTGTDLTGGSEVSLRDTDNIQTEHSTVGMTDNINNSLVQEIDVLIDRIQSE